MSFAIDGTDVLESVNGHIIEAYYCHAGYERKVGHWWACVSDGYCTSGKKFDNEAEAKAWAASKVTAARKLAHTASDFEVAS